MIEENRDRPFTDLESLELINLHRFDPMLLVAFIFYKDSKTEEDIQRITSTANREGIGIVEGTWIRNYLRDFERGQLESLQKKAGNRAVVIKSKRSMKA